MVETYDPELIATYLNGAASESFLMVKLMGQVVVILFVGIFLWRVSTAFSGKKQPRRKSVFGETGYQKQWRNRK